ncbi:MAG: hypothetical protein US25_C0049G0006 [Candidatus Moranbacteria bacterium GW2011_GWE1_36_7]|nr:MAG: hypothetical protein UR99_C0006G0001 [Candidatus Moranbacteria bacterium GW2011_GWD2_36_12]KKQ07127.1 MAG: hypothetical protein US16_C0002G0001 [Candidatus Moranbacteria bacterium GW2011_GWE2_36_40]KKQ12515.1 MAG: hypothetical protein US25_C0049G0006 [Candidatus Moranbacteria bacterium GW2011_GWE1_36_7]
MPTKTKQTSHSRATGQNKKETKSTDWKGLVQGFVGNMLEQLNENVTNRVHAWTKQMKRRAIGGVVMVLGASYLLTGISSYAESTLGKNIPGLGYMAIGTVALLIGYLVSRK